VGQCVPGRDLTLTDKQTFVADIEKRHGQRLRRFLAARLRHRAADVPDLVQEVFLRLLRIDRHETIRSSEAYLFTVAFHVLHQHVLRRAAMPEAVEISALINEMESAPATDPALQVETQQRLEALQGVLQQLSPKAQAVLLLHRRDGYSLEEIGARLGVSRAMAAKYLSKALLHCRQRLQDRK
jgi:RNA polymerase sigma factor (sigma-70 family)